RPAELAGEGRGLGDVARVDSRVLLAVDLDAHEVVVEHRRDLGVAERLPRHDVTPVAGRVTDGDEDGNVTGGCLVERILPPLAPVDGVVGVRTKIRAEGGGEPIDHASSLGSVPASLPGSDVCGHGVPVAVGAAHERQPAQNGEVDASFHSVRGEGVLGEVAGGGIDADGQSQGLEEPEEWTELVLEHERVTFTAPGCGEQYRLVHERSEEHTSELQSRE